MTPQKFVTAPAVARAAGCSAQTVQNRIAAGVLIPDGWLDAPSGRQPLFRAQRLIGLGAAVMPAMPHQRFSVIAEPMYVSDLEAAAAVAGATT